MPSSFRLARQLLSRIEDENTGEIKPEWLHIEITDKMKEQAKKIVEMNSDSVDDFPLLKGVEKQVKDPLDIFLTMNLAPSLSIIGADGIPSIQDAGNVLRTNTDLKVSIRTPPGISADEVAKKVQALLEANPPVGNAFKYGPSPCSSAPTLYIGTATKALMTIMKNTAITENLLKFIVCKLSN
jgi:acetylornithine deacetylase/succinyl-diaminopimelate desuccinylase-like protein